MTAQPITLTLDNQTIGAIAYGDSSKPLIIALHGWLDNAASFIELAALLNQYYIIALDFPGHGLTVINHDQKQFHFSEYV